MVLLSKTAIITGMGQEGTGGRVGRECQLWDKYPEVCVLSCLTHCVTGQKSVSSRLISVETGSGQRTPIKSSLVCHLDKRLHRRKVSMFVEESTACLFYLLFKNFIHAYKYFWYYSPLLFQLLLDPLPHPLLIIYQVGLLFDRFIHVYTEFSPVCSYLSPIPSNVSPAIHSQHSWLFVLFVIHVV